DYIDSHFEKEIKSTQKNIKKSLLLSLILFVISLLLIVFMFFKFSGDLDSKQEEINVLKKRLGISHLQSSNKSINLI
ncbi:MAG: hypothetical protein KJO48_03440, partial [Ignavibacteria bacterium]|nr:hypothetical protein [Ignavibacteria bacterium]